MCRARTGGGHCWGSRLARARVGSWGSRLWWLSWWPALVTATVAQGDKARQALLEEEGEKGFWKCGRR